MLFALSLSLLALYIPELQRRRVSRIAGSGPEVDFARALTSLLPRGVGVGGGGDRLKGKCLLGVVYSYTTGAMHLGLLCGGAVGEKAGCANFGIK